MAKKLDTHDVKLPTGEAVSVPIYVDTGSGIFSAKVGQDEKRGSNMPELRSWIDEMVKKAKLPVVEYAPFIQIDQVKNPDSYRSYERERSVALRFSFEVMLLSVEVYEDVRNFRSDKRTERYRLKQLAFVNENTLAAEHDFDAEKQAVDRNRVRSFPERRHEDVKGHEGNNSTIVPYTQHRYRALCAIRDNIELLRVRLDKLLVQEPGGADALDTMPIRALLTPAEPEPVKKAKR